MRMLCDFHTHSLFSKDAARDMTFGNICEAALENGVGSLAVTDHYDIGLPYKFDPLAREEGFLEAKDRYAGRVNLLRGVELGEMLAGPEEADRIRTAVPYDVVLGSLHALQSCGDFYDLDYANRTDEELRSLWQAYLEELTDLAERGDFDILTHIRYPERYYIRAGKERLLPIEERGCEMFEPVLRALIRRDKALEINTSVVRKSGRPADPGVALLRFYRSIGGKHLSVGSDAHRLRDIGADLKGALEMAKEAGFSEISVFSGRVLRHLAIRDVLAENV